jgi:OFA family oxalate/formate antiporter-like MFS transporter
MMHQIETRTANGQEEPAAQPRRWLIAAAAALMQAAVGATYAWSVIRDPLAAEHGWTIPEVTLAYSLNLFGLGIFAFLGGLWMRRVGPRTVGIAAGLLYGLGLSATGLFGDQLWGLYLAFGVVAGIGRGLGWVVPMAMAVKWFPDRRGLVSGVSLAGNGLGALVAAPLATGLIERIGVLPMFSVLGALLLLMVVGAALALREPPEGYCPPGWEPPLERSAHGARHDYTVGEAVRTFQWYGLWALLFVSSSAGLAIFSHASPMAQELTGIGAMAAAGVVGVLSMANAVGRLCWAWLSDLVDRRLVFTAMLFLLAAALRTLPLTSVVVGFALLASVAMLCFGGGLGTMPAFAADYFGSKHVGPIMGLLMTAQGSAAMVGPMVLASARETSGSYAPALSALAVALALAALLPLALRPPVRPGVVRAQVRPITRIPRARARVAILVFALALAGSSTGQVAYADEEVRQAPSPAADLGVALYVPRHPHPVGSLTYTVAVTNRGPGTATNVRASLALPQSDSFGSARAERGACTHTDQVVLCRIGSLARDETISVAVTVYPHWTGGNVVARAVADEPDHSPANNSATEIMRAPASSPTLRPGTCPPIQRLAPESLVAIHQRPPATSYPFEGPAVPVDTPDEQPVAEDGLLASTCSPV